MAALLADLPPSSSTLTASLFNALCTKMQAEREASLGDHKAWESAGYPEHYPGAVFSKEQLRATVNNLRVALRKLHTTGKTKYLWAVERVKGGEEGFRLRVLDPGRCRAFSGNWVLRHYDPEVWATKHTMQFLDEPGVRPPDPIRRLTTYSLMGLAAVAVGWAGVAGSRLWQEGAAERKMRARRDALTAGAHVESVSCTSSLWHDKAQSPDWEWSRCEHAADGLILGREAWKSVEEPSSAQEWVKVALREPAAVRSVRLHWRAEPGVCFGRAEDSDWCRAPGNPALLMVEGSMDGVNWVTLLNEAPCPAMAPWEPMDLAFSPVTVRYVRVTATEKRADRGSNSSFQLAEIVINPIPLEEYPVELPTAGMFASAGG